MQRNGRRVGPEVQSALAAKQQAEQWQDMEPLQEQFDGYRKTLDQQKAAAQKLQEVCPALPRPALPCPALPCPALPVVLCDSGQCGEVSLLPRLC